LDDLLPNSIHQINTAGMYRMTPQSESSIKDDFAASIASTDASLLRMQTLGNASPGSQLPSDSHFASFNNPSDLPMFDHKVFTTLINDLNFNISILDAVPKCPPFNPPHIPKSLSLWLLTLMTHHPSNILKSLSLWLLTLMIHHLPNIPKSLSLQLLTLTMHLPNILKSLSLWLFVLMMHYLTNIPKLLSLQLLMPMSKIWEHSTNLMVLALTQMLKVCGMQKHQLH
jgi:hypothetical protein